MRLSEAIRLGAMLKPQTTGTLTRRVLVERGRMVEATCALGAAFDAIGKLHEARRINGDLITEEGTVYTDVAWHVIAKDAGWEDWWHVGVTTEGLWAGTRPVTLLAAIVELNDRQLWTREAIADWVAEVEQGQHRAPGPEGRPALTVDPSEQTVA